MYDTSIYTEYREKKHLHLFEIESLLEITRLELQLYLEELCRITIELLRFSVPMGICCKSNTPWK
jgi:hypothetical protein